MMTSVSDKISEFKRHHAIGALSGATEVLDFINEGKTHLIYPHYKKTCEYGDWEKVRGIEEILEVMNRKELLKQPLTQVYFEETHELDEEFTFDEEIEFLKDEVDLFIRLEEGRYVITAELNKEGKDGEYSIEILNQCNGRIDHGWGYVSKEKAYFSVNEFEEGICKINITALKWSKIKKVIVERI